MIISIIIPTLNEAASIGKLIRYILACPGQELLADIIVADGGSSDATTDRATEAGAIIVNCSKQSRAFQMNCGARKATGTILYFLHADTFPPQNFLVDIQNAVKTGVAAGCFRLSFDYPHWFLNCNAWFTRFNIAAVRFGDQSLFVCTSCFEKSGGFNEEQLLLEDQELVKRLSRIGTFKILNEYVITSARKYRQNGIYKLQFIFFMIYTLYRMGIDQKRLIKIYQNLIC